VSAQTRELPPIRTRRARRSEQNERGMICRQEAKVTD
jgi:hypothetical protein